MPAFSRLIRFLAKDGSTYYGDAILSQGIADISRSKRAHIITGDIFGKHYVTDQVVDIRLLLPPLAPLDVGTVRCIGLNYENHAKEANMEQPKYPLLFYKPTTSLSGPFDPIVVPSMAQETTGVDYECEMVIVIGKRCRDVPESGALDCVLGYAVGNDVTHRDWQLQRGGSQWSHGKGFDTWAPYGPGIVSSNVIKDPQNLRIWTRVNGETLQDACTAEMIFGVKKVVALLSRGVTLMPGDLIFTGTPAGVGMCRNPQTWLKHGDVVEVGLEHIGTCTNRIEFEKGEASL